MKVDTKKRLKTVGKFLFLAYTYFLIIAIISLFIDDWNGWAIKYRCIFLAIVFIGTMLLALLFIKIKNKKIGRRLFLIPIYFFMILGMLSILFMCLIFYVIFIFITAFIIIFLLFKTKSRKKKVTLIILLLAIIIFYFFPKKYSYSIQTSVKDGFKRESFKCKCAGLLWDDQSEYPKCLGWKYGCEKKF